MVQEAARSPLPLALLTAGARPRRGALARLPRSRLGVYRARAPPRSRARVWSVRYDRSDGRLTMAK